MSPQSAFVVHSLQPVSNSASILPQPLPPSRRLTQRQPVPPQPVAPPQIPPALGQVLAAAWQVPFSSQTEPLAQAPQFTLPPQPSGAVPQFCPAGQAVRGVQPQTLAPPPPPQVWEPVQLDVWLHVPPTQLAGVQASTAPQTVPQDPQLAASVATLTLVPAHVPLVQTSLQVAAFPSLQDDPFGFAGFEHCPVAGLHVPAS